MLKDSRSIRPSCSIHSIKSHLKVWSIQQTLNGFEIKQMFHGFNIQRHIFYYFNDKCWLCRPLNMGKMIFSYFVNIDWRKKKVISCYVLSNLNSFLIDRISEFFLGWSSIAGIKFNSKIFMRTSRIMTCRQKDSTQTVATLLILLSNIGRTCRSWH